MKLLRSYQRAFSAVIVVLAAYLFLCAPAAMAYTGTSADLVFEQVQVKDGAFAVSTESTIKSSVRISAALISLPPGESGTIDEIVITGPNGEREFGCSNVKVMNGTDLIVSCGGPAYLNAGPTVYKARGSGFGPTPDVALGIELNPN